MSYASDSEGGPAGSAIYRTTPARTVRMMAIMLGICVAGGGIFFGMWDYWISQTPPVVEVMAGSSAPEAVEVELTGVELPVSLSFVESDDLIVLSFNAQPGEPGRNPTIEANVGDRITFDVVNDGISFHSFGVTADAEGTGGIYPGSEVASPNNPLTGGQSGTSEFVAPEDGIYYYICTVPGHRLQGMEGMIIVGDVDASEVEAAEAAAAEAETAAAEQEAPAVDRVFVELEGAISIPEGSSVAGCEAADECYIPAGVVVEPGTTVVWSNDDTAAHTVTSSPESPMSFDSGLFMADTTFEVTFEDPGEYPYWCIVHPWMTGTVVVGDAAAMTAGSADDAMTIDDSATAVESSAASDDAMADDAMTIDDSATAVESSAASDDAMADDADADTMTVDDSATAVESSAASDDANAPVELDGPISLPAGSSIAGCERTDECYIPSSVVVPAGTTVVWSNDDTAAHTVTSTDESPMSFDSSLFMPDTTFEVTFEDPGEYPYWCIVHPWMVGTVTVE